MMRSQRYFPLHNKNETVCKCACIRFTNEHLFFIFCVQTFCSDALFCASGVVWWCRLCVSKVRCFDIVFVGAIVIAKYTKFNWQLFICCLGTMSAAAVAMCDHLSAVDHFYFCAHCCENLHFVFYIIVKQCVAGWQQQKKIEKKKKIVRKIFNKSLTIEWITADGDCVILLATACLCPLFKENQYNTIFIVY